MPTNDNFETRFRTLHELLFDSSAAPEQIAHFRTRMGQAEGASSIAAALLLTKAGLDSLSDHAIDLHLFIIHNARMKLVRYLLPPGDVILDLGGANAPLYHMGYPHRFRRLVLIDLPTEERYRDFQEVNLEMLDDGGEVVVRYQDMTDLIGIPDTSVDLVWSGQSIEHVTPEQGQRMCAEAFRVLKPGGHFCLDTPNRLLTVLHTAWMGGGFIHPDHKVEYKPAELRQLLVDSGFRVEKERGVCDMPLTVESGEFRYQDFLVGGAITNNIEGSYIQYFQCVKP